MQWYITNDKIKWNEIELDTTIKQELICANLRPAKHIKFLSFGEFRSLQMGIFLQNESNLSTSIWAKVKYFRWWSLRNWREVDQVVCLSELEKMGSFKWAFASDITKVQPSKSRGGPGLWCDNTPHRGLFHCLMPEYARRCQTSTLIRVPINFWRNSDPFKKKTFF